MKKAARLFAVAVPILIVVGFWLWSHTQSPMGNSLSGDVPDKLLAWGRLTGLLAVCAILFQFALIGRVRWVEQAFGMDRLTRLDHIVGFAMILLLVAHPILVTFGHAMQAETGYWAQSFDFCKTWEGLLSAYVGLALLFAASVASVLVLVKRMPYGRWYATHLVLYAAFGLTVLHQVEVGSDLTAHAGFRAYWYALYAGALAFLVLYRFVRPLALLARHRFAVTRIVPEADDVTSIYLGGKALKRFPAAAGQFLIVRFLAKGYYWEAHPFSLSRPPDGEQLRLTIKRLGDFTRRIPQLKPGTPVLIEGPFGVFTARGCASAKVLLIAGGIGITPIRSLAEELVATGREVTLIYANRTRASTVFGQELEELAGRSNGRLTLILVMSDEAAWAGPKGRVDRALLARLVPDAQSRDAFICGPHPMMKSVRAALTGLGVASSRIHDERFAL